jgi:hypothetical protein
MAMDEDPDAEASLALPWPPIREVKARLIAANQWSEAEFAAYDAEQERLGVLRSEFYWALDLSLVARGPLLVVDTGPRA